MCVCVCDSGELWIKKQTFWVKVWHRYFYLCFESLCLTPPSATICNVYTVLNGNTLAFYILRPDIHLLKCNKTLHVSAYRIEKQKESVI